jgi:hypothetical protein
MYKQWIKVNTDSGLHVHKGVALMDVEFMADESENGCRSSFFWLIYLSSAADVQRPTCVLGTPKWITRFIYILSFSIVTSIVCIV